VKIRAFLSISIIFINLNFLFSQIGKKGIPDDLKTSEIIFLKYDSAAESNIKPKGKDEKIRSANKKKHNKKVPKANNELMASTKKYPFNYVITCRNEIDKYKARGCKYVLDFQPFIKLKEGVMQADADNTESYPLFLRDLTNEDIYIVEYVDQSFAYQYSDIIEKIFLKEVKKKYKLK